MKNGNKIIAFIALFTIIFSLSFISVCYAEENSKFILHYPQPGDDMIYYWEFEKQVEEVDFSDIALYISSDVAESGKQHLLRANWLPDIPVDELDNAMFLRTSFRDKLESESEYLEYSDIFERDVDDLIDESGLTQQEAEEWYTCIHVPTSETYPFRIEIFNNFELYGRDIILGAYGAEATSVEEGKINDWKMIKASVDYTHLYDDIDLNEEQWQTVLRSIVQNYVFLFDEEAEYMICISGTMPMEKLEKIGENLEVLETELIRTDYDEGVNYILQDLAKG